MLTTIFLAVLQVLWDLVRVAVAAEFCPAVGVGGAERSAAAVMTAGAGGGGRSDIMQVRIHSQGKLAYIILPPI